MCCKADVIAGFLGTFLCGIAVSPCTGQPAEPGDKHAKTDKLHLAWKFAAGDVIHVQHRVVKDFENESSKTRQEHIYKYFWIVEKLTGEGTAKVRLAFEDIAYIQGDPPVEFHTASDDATKFPRSENSDWMKYQARSTANADISFEVLPNGGTLLVQGADSVSDARSFTPGDLPGLPNHPVAVGDSWRLPIQAGPMEGESTCTLMSIDHINGRRVAQIESVVKWQAVAGSIPDFANVQFEPSISVSRFDTDAGRFLEEEVKSKFHALASRSFSTDERQDRDTKGTTTVSIEQRRRMAIGERGPAPQLESGKYILVYHEGRFEGLVMAGAKVRKPTDPPISATQLFEVDFFHSWQDDNRDDLPTPTELSDVSTRFADGEDVKFLVLLLGMQNRKLHFELLDSTGNELAKNVIPIRPGPGAVAVREMRLPSGIYFFEFFIDNEFLLRVPVQVFSNRQPSTQ